MLNSFRTVLNCLKMSEKEKVSIRIELEGDLALKFSQIKKRLGVEKNSEVVRVLITQEKMRQEEAQ